MNVGNTVLLQCGRRADMKEDGKREPSQADQSYKRKVCGMGGLLEE